MRTVHLIVIHCSATKENETLTEIELEKSHRQRGLNGIGYHYYIRRDGNIKSTRSVRKPGAHAQGHNLDSIAICYEGGLNRHGLPKDTRTQWQKHSMIVLLKTLLIVENYKLPGNSFAQFFCYQFQQFVIRGVVIGIPHIFFNEIIRVGFFAEEVYK